MRYFIAIISCFLLLQCKNKSNESSDKIPNTTEIANGNESDTISQSTAESVERQKQNRTDPNTAAVKEVPINAELKEKKEPYVEKNINEQKPIEKGTEKETPVIPKQGSTNNPEPKIEKPSSGTVVREDNHTNTKEEKPELPVEKKTVVLPEDFILGKWMNEDATRKIEIFKSGNDFIGKLIYDSEAKAPVGTQILKLKYRSGKWEGSTIPPENNDEIKTVVTKIDQNTLQFVASKGIVSKKKKWKRL